MNIKITQTNPSYNLKLNSSDLNKYKIQFAYNVEIPPQKIDDLIDVEISEVNGEIDNYVLVYNSNTGTWQAVNPDVVLSAAATEPIQPGLPTDFVDEVNTDLATALDSKIDVDAGAFPNE